MGLPEASSIIGTRFFFTDRMGHMDILRVAILVCTVLSQGCGASGDGPGSGLKKDVDRGNSEADDSGSPTVIEDSGAEGTDTAGGGPEEVPDDSIGDTLASASDLRGLESWNLEVPLASDAIDYEGDRDVYKMAIPAGSVVFLAVRSAGEADLVLTVLNASGTTIGESRQMPYWAWGRDPGLWVQARGAGGLFVEVSSVSDFETSSDYDLLGTVVAGDDGEPNDTAEDAGARLADGTAGFRGSLVSSGRTEFMGSLQHTADVDYWAFDATSTGLMSWSLWATGSAVLEPSLTLYDSAFTPLAWTDEPHFLGGGTWLDDSGLLAAVNGGERYYLEVRNLRPAFGAGTTYVGVSEMVDAVTSEWEPNDDGSQANGLSLSLSTTHPGYSSGTTHGSLDGVDGVDVYSLPVESMVGGYLSVHVQAGSVGSGLTPRAIVCSDVAGTDVLAVLEAGVKGDLSLVDVELVEALAAVYVRIEAVGRKEALSGNRYVLGLERYTVPLHD
jgi:hypothetical protein